MRQDRTTLSRTEKDAFIALMYEGWKLAERRRMLWRQMIMVSDHLMVVGLMVTLFFGGLTLVAAGSGELFWCIICGVLLLTSFGALITGVIAHLQSIKYWKAGRREMQTTSETTTGSTDPRHRKN